MRSLLGWLSTALGASAEGGAPDRPHAGPYRLLARLGEGGMGEVWRGEHRHLRRQVAVKLIRPDALVARSGRRREEWLARFEREAQVTARLRSPHTVTVFDYGPTEDGGAYYAMELLEGLELETLVERFGPLPPARAVAVLEQLCESLAEAHELGLVHRDVKPANVFLARVGLDLDVVKVLDFGLVRGPDDARITSPDAVVGTPAYMAPEVVEGQAVDARADVYAVGCIAYWLLTGTDVFGGRDSTPMQVMLDHARRAPERPSSRLGHDLPAGLEALVMSCLEKDPRDRPWSGLELLRRLRAVRPEPAWTQVDARRWWLAHLPALADPKGEGRATTVVDRVQAA